VQRTHNGLIKKFINFCEVKSYVQMHSLGMKLLDSQCELGSEFQTAARGFQESDAASAGTCMAIKLASKNLALQNGNNTRQKEDDERSP
jgi:hypothetical protein